MRLTTPDPDLAEVGPVKQWLHTVTQRMLTVFLRSNLYNALPVVYGDLGVFGTGAMAVLEDDKDLLRCYPFPIGSYALGLNDRQICGTFVREYQLTVRQVIEGFAMNPQTKAIDWSVVSTNVKTLWDRQQYEQPIEICWIVAPNADADESRLGSEFLPFTSTYFERGSDKDDTILKRSGYHEMPILAPRWEVSGEDTYGTDCPGMTVLGDIKALQIMQRRKAQAVELMINPSLQGPTHLRSQKVSLLPGDITYTDTLQNQEGLRPIREVRLSVAELTADIQDTRLLIRRGFYEDLFLMLAQTDQVQPITAREVQERHEEKLLALGPMLERMNDELLDPLVDRVFGIMSRAGIIPEPPQELVGTDLRVEYISIMAQAQRLVGVVGLDRFVNSMLPLVQVFPDVRYKLNTMQLADEYSELLGINPKLVVPDDEAQQALQQAQQQAQQAQQAQIALQQAQATKNLAQAPTDTDSALSRMLEGVQQ